MERDTSVCQCQQSESLRLFPQSPRKAKRDQDWISKVRLWPCIVLALHCQGADEYYVGNEVGRKLHNTGKYAPDLINHKLLTLEVKN